MNKILDKIRSLSGNEQLEYLKSEECPTLGCILYMTYNPYLVYKIQETKYNKIKEEIGEVDLLLNEDYNQLTNEFVDMLSDLSKLKGVTDEKAKEIVTYIESLGSEEYKEIFKGMLFKDLKLGLGVSTINKVWPNLIPTFVVQRMKNYEDKKGLIKDKVPYKKTLLSRKFNGVCVIFTKEADKILCLGRTGKEFDSDRFLKIKKDVEEYLDIHNYVYLGEVVWLDPETTKDDFQKSMTKELDDEKSFVIFDRILKKDFYSQTSDISHFDSYNSLLDEFDLNDNDLTAIIDLDNMLYSFDDDYYSLSIKIAYNDEVSDKEYIDYVKKQEKNKWEGLILRNADASYDFCEGSKRSNNIKRYKPRKDDEFPFIELLEGSGKYTGTLGNIVVSYNDNTVKVGTGFTDSDRQKLWPVKEDLKKLKLLVKVSFLDYTDKGSLQQPSFQGFRDYDLNELSIDDVVRLCNANK